MVHTNHRTMTSPGHEVMAALSPSRLSARLGPRPPTWPRAGAYIWVIWVNGAGFALLPFPPHRADAGSGEEGVNGARINKQTSHRHPHTIHYIHAQSAWKVGDPLSC